MPNSKLEIKVNYEKAVDVAKKVIKRMQENRYPFNLENSFPDARIPTDIIPGSFKHALLLFYGCNLDGLGLSEFAYSSARSLISTFGYTPLHKVEKTKLIQVLQPYYGSSTRKSVHTTIDFLTANSEKLTAEYGGDPRNLKKDTIEETLKAMEEFKQIGVGKAALLLKNFVRFNLVDFSPFDLPIKADRHLKKICVGAEVIEFYYEGERIPYKKQHKVIGKFHAGKLVKPLMNTFSRVTQNNQISAVDLNDGVWAMGSKMCKKNRFYHCLTHCDINCRTRPKADEKDSYLFPGTENRIDVRKKKDAKAELFYNPF